MAMFVHRCSLPPRPPPDPLPQAYTTTTTMYSITSATFTQWIYWLMNKHLHNTVALPPTTSLPTFSNISMVPTMCMVPWPPSSPPYHQLIHSTVRQDSPVTMWSPSSAGLGRAGPRPGQARPGTNTARVKAANHSGPLTAPPVTQL